MMAAENAVVQDAPILQVQQKLYNVAAPKEMVEHTCLVRNMAATNAEMRRNAKGPANVGDGVVLFGNGQAVICVDADGEARFQSEQHLLISHCFLLENPHRSQFQSKVMMHGPEKEQRCHTALLPYLRRDLEGVLFEEHALRLGSKLFRCVDQSWDHGEAATFATPPIRGELQFDRLVADKSVAEDLVA